MTKTLISAAALAVLTAGAAAAMTPSVATQNILDEHGFSVDAGSLTDFQVAALKFVDDEGGNASDAQVRAQINSILNR